MDTLSKVDCIRTFTGIDINVFEPTPEMINIEDIAHALSMQCRFGGHLPKFYSVAQHSLICSQIVDKENSLAALLHDASEAYLVDIPRPIKQRLSNYKEIENALMTLIAEKFGFKYPLHSQVKQADEVMLKVEWNELMLNNVNDSAKVIHRCYSQTDAKNEFLEAFRNISNNKHNFV